MPGATSTFRSRCRAVHSAANAWARRGSRSKTVTALSPGSVVRSRRSTSSLMTPQPTSVTPASGTSAARVAAASAADAAVRRAEMVAASSSASGAPVRIEFRIITALARGRPAATLPGNDEIHLIPATASSPLSSPPR